MAIEFRPMRSMIFTDLAKEQYRHKLLKWHMLHVEDADNLDADAFRATTGKKGGRPFVFGFHPLSWEEDWKGKERTIEDGANYRFIFMVQWPEGVAEEAGERWLREEVLSKWVEMPEVTRILTSHIYQDVNNCPFSRVVEVWFDGPEEWHKVCVERAAEYAKPAFAQTDVFPYLEPSFNFTSIFVTDIPYSDNYTQYRGYIAKR